jgi:hypothetical protein
MAQKKKAPGYILFYECPLRNRVTGTVVKTLMLMRSGVVDLEMAQSLTVDLTRLGIYWEIRNSQTGVVVEKLMEVVK